MAANLSVAELESLLKERQSELTSLSKERASLVSQLEKVDAKIAELEGTSKPARTRKKTVKRKKVKAAAARKSKKVRRKRKGATPLRSVVADVLGNTKKGMTVAEVMEAVQQSGYQSTSSNFRNVLYQCLYHTDGFAQNDKGLWVLGEKKKA